MRNSLSEMSNEKEAEFNCNLLWNVPCNNPSCTDLFCEVKNKLILISNPNPYRLTLPYQTPGTLLQNSIEPFEFYCPTDEYTPCTTPGCTDLFCDIKRNRALSQAPVMEPVFCPAPPFSEPFTECAVSSIGPPSAASAATKLAAYYASASSVSSAMSFDNGSQLQFDPDFWSCGLIQTSGAGLEFATPA